MRRTALALLLPSLFLSIPVALAASSCAPPPSLAGAQPSATAWYIAVGVLSLVLSTALLIAAMRSIRRAGRAVAATTLRTVFGLAAAFSWVTLHVHPPRDPSWGMAEHCMLTGEYDFYGNPLPAPPKPWHEPLLDWYSTGDTLPQAIYYGGQLLLGALAVWLLASAALRIWTLLRGAPGSENAEDPHKGGSSESEPAGD